MSPADRGARRAWPTRDTGPEILAGIVVTAMFGPYLPGAPIRAEHLVLYSLPIVFLFAHGWLPKNHGVPLGAARAWFATIVVVLLSLVPMVLGEGPTLVNAVRVLDWHLLPVACAFSVAVLVHRTGSTDRVTVTAMWVIVWLLAVNTILMVFPSVVPGGFVDAFWSAGGASGRGTVASRAATMGRSSGIFNQPAEAGVAYLLGLVAWNTLARRGFSGARGLLLWLTLPAIAIGGVLPISKVFLYGAPVLIAFLSWRGFLEGRLARGSASIFGLLSVAAIAPAVLTPSAIERIASRFQFADPSSAISTMTGGRFSPAGTQLQAELATLLGTRPLFGYGLFASGQVGPLDSQVLATLAITGLAGVLALVWAIAAVLVRIRALPTPQRSDSLALLLVFLGAGIGVPVLFLNRIGSVFVFMLTLALWPKPGRVPTHGATAEATRLSVARESSQGPGDVG